MSTPMVKRGGDENHVTEAELDRFFKTVLVFDTYEEWLGMLANPEQYEREAANLTDAQRKCVRRFARTTQCRQ